MCRSPSVDVLQFEIKLKDATAAEAAGELENERERQAFATMQAARVSPNEA